MPVGRKPGTPKTGGRTAGTPNKRTVDGEAYARAIIEDEEGIATLRGLFRQGVLPPQLLLHLWQLAYGTPKELTVYAIAASNGESPGAEDPPTRYVLTPL
jgi:hypothetical protein